MMSAGDMSMTLILIFEFEKLNDFVGCMVTEHSLCPSRVMPFSKVNDLKFSKGELK